MTFKVAPMCSKVHTIGNSGQGPSTDDFAATDMVKYDEKKKCNNNYLKYILKTLI